MIVSLKPKPLDWTTASYFTKYYTIETTLNQLVRSTFQVPFNAPLMEEVYPNFYIFCTLLEPFRLHVNPMTTAQAGAKDLPKGFPIPISSQRMDIANYKRFMGSDFKDINQIPLIAHKLASRSNKFLQNNAYLVRTL